jgi:integrase/recombinase XerD
MPKQARKRTHFLSANKKTKFGIVSKMVRLARKERLNYDDFLYVCQQVRKKLGLRRPERQQKLPQLLPATVLKRFFQVIEECGDVQHEIMLKLLFYTAIRVSELVRIETTDVDLVHCKIFIDRGREIRIGTFYSQKASAWCLRAI